MRMAAFLALLAVATGAAGCGKPAPTGPAISTASSGDLKTTLAIDREFARVGQTLHVTLMARNTGIHTLQIEARTGAPMLVTIWKYDVLKGWQRIGQYPEAAIFQLTPWKLGPFAQRTFEMDVPVGQSWPTNENIRLSAELNGRPDARPYLLVKVLTGE